MLLRPLPLLLLAPAPVDGQAASAVRRGQPQPPRPVVSRGRRYGRGRQQERQQKDALLHHRGRRTRDLPSDLDFHLLGEEKVLVVGRRRSNKGKPKLLFLLLKMGRGG